MECFYVRFHVKVLYHTKRWHRRGNSSGLNLLVPLENDEELNCEIYIALESWGFSTRCNHSKYMSHQNYACLFYLDMQLKLLCQKFRWKHSQVISTTIKCHHIQKFLYPINWNVKLISCDWNRLSWNPVLTKTTKIQYDHEICGAAMTNERTVSEDPCTDQWWLILQWKSEFTFQCCYKRSRFWSIKIFKTWIKYYPQPNITSFSCKNMYDLSKKIIHETFIHNVGRFVDFTPIWLYPHHFFYDHNTCQRKLTSISKLEQIGK